MALPSTFADHPNIRIRNLEVVLHSCSPSLISLTCHVFIGHKHGKQKIVESGPRNIVSTKFDTHLMAYTCRHLTGYNIALRVHYLVYCE